MRRDLTPPNFLAVLEHRNKLSKSECYNCGEQVEHQGCCDRCEKTAMEIYATSALPYPFPVDSEIYDH